MADNNFGQKEYYELHAKKRLSFCLFSMKAMGLMLIIILLGTGLFSCGPKSYALLPEGIPLKQDGDRILGVFPAFQSDRYYGQWFYLPGQGLINTDEYRLRVILERKEP